MTNEGAVETINAATVVFGGRVEGYSYEHSRRGEIQREVQIETEAGRGSFYLKLDRGELPSLDERFRGSDISDIRVRITVELLP